jgi:hypothetical protein
MRSAQSWEPKAAERGVPGVRGDAGRAWRAWQAGAADAAGAVAQMGARGLEQAARAASSDAEAAPRAAVSRAIARGRAERLAALALAAAGGAGRATVRAVALRAHQRHGAAGAAGAEGAGCPAAPATPRTASATAGPPTLRAEVGRRRGTAGMAGQVERYRRRLGAGGRHRPRRTALAVRARAADQVDGVGRGHAAPHAAGHRHRAEVRLQLLAGVPALAEQRVAGGEQVDLLEAIAEVEVGRVVVVAGELHAEGDGHAAGGRLGIAAGSERIGRSRGHHRLLAGEARALRRIRRVVAAGAVGDVGALADGSLGHGRRRIHGEPGLVQDHSDQNPQ